MDDDRSEPIITEQSLDAPVERVWQAITDPDQMRRWYFDTITDFEPRPGFVTQVPLHAESRTFHSRWTVGEVLSPNRIVVVWEYEDDDVDGRGEVLWEVEPDGSGSLIRVTNTGLDTFPAEYPEFSREACVGGWDFFLRGRLPEFLAAGR